jgi:hypothetical protein
MTLKELEEEIGIIVNDASLAEYYKRWINEAVLAIAEDLALPALRLTNPATVTITSDAWEFPVPDNFQKQLFRAGVFTGTPSAGTYYPLHIAKRGFDTLNDLDPAHTQTDTHPWQIAIQHHSIGVFPKADDTLYLWYFKKPTLLSKPNDVPTCIPDAYHPRVIIPKVIIKNFRALQDMVIQPPHQSIQFWQNEYKAGLYGERYGDVGLVNVLAREKPPRRHGGHDPIWTGWRSW